mgnify:CR=1 FL=1
MILWDVFCFNFVNWYTYRYIDFNTSNGYRKNCHLFRASNTNLCQHLNLFQNLVNYVLEIVAPTGTLFMLSCNFYWFISSCHSMFGVSIQYRYSRRVTYCQISSTKKPARHLQFTNKCWSELILPSFSYSSQFQTEGA